MKNEIKWLTEPEEHDYPAAVEYLRLTLTDEVALYLGEKLREEKVVTFKAKDIFRASELSLLGISNSHVKKDLKKIKKGKKISPLLLVRLNDKLIIADGYHRLCALYQLSEDVVIHCKIV